jgi:hypothetical protein
VLVGLERLGLDLQQESHASQLLPSWLWSGCASPRGLNNKYQHSPYLLTTSVGDVVSSGTQQDTWQTASRCDPIQLHAHGLQRVSAIVKLKNYSEAITYIS